MASIGSRLREAIDASGLTQREVLARAGLSRQQEVWLSKVLHGACSKPRVDLLAKVAAVLGVSTDWLVLGGNGNGGNGGERPVPQPEAAPASYDDAHEAAEEALVRAAELSEGRRDRRERLRRMVARWAKVIAVAGAISASNGIPAGTSGSASATPKLDIIYPGRRRKMRATNRAGEELDAA